LVIMDKVEVYDSINNALKESVPAEIKASEKITPRAKSAKIVKLIKEYHKFNAKFAKTNDESEKSLYNYYASKNWAAARGIAGGLSELEQSIFIEYLTKDIEKRAGNPNKLLDNIMLYNSILRVFPEDLAPEMLAKKQELEQLVQEKFDPMTFEK